MEDSLRELGRVSQSCRSLGWQEARENYRQSLTSLAERYPISLKIAEGLVANLEAFVGGDEHINIRIANEPERIFKITKADQFGCDVLFDPHDPELTGRNFLARGNDDPWFYLERWRLLNSIGEYHTRFEGLVAPERNGWLPRICVSQPVLIEKNPTQKEISDSLEPFGFHEVSLGAYYSSESNILLSDAFPRNVRIHQGIPALFDAIASTPPPSVVKWLKGKSPTLA